MTAYHADLAALSVPRYTSYPTAVSFSGKVGASEQRQALGALADDAKLSLYLHVPFCETICWYCGCNTGAVGRADPTELGCRQGIGAAAAEVDMGDAAADELRYRFNLT